MNSKYYKKFDEDYIEFYDSKTDKRTLELVYMDGKIYLIRIYLDDIDKEIKNKILLFNKKLSEVFLCYEKHFQRNGKEVIEEYLNDELGTYYETEHLKNSKITKGFSASGDMFFREIIEYDKEGNEISEESLVYNDDGTKTEHKIDLTKMDRETFFNM